MVVNFVCYHWLSGVLDEDADDTLINVNIIDDERAAKNVENKKKKPGYQAYDDSEFDEFGTVCYNCIITIHCLNKIVALEFLRDFRPF